MKLTKTENLTENQKTKISEIWNAEYPISLRFSEENNFEKYLSKLQNCVHYVLNDDFVSDFDEENALVAWLCVFTRENERWFAMLVNGNYQKQGIGKLLLDNAKKDESELNGWIIDNNESKKENNMPYLSPIGFYLKNNFEILTNIRLENEQISAVKILWKTLIIKPSRS